MGIVFVLLEVPLLGTSGNSGCGDRAVLGIWSKKWKVPEALQALKLKYKQEDGDPRATPTVKSVSNE